MSGSARTSRAAGQFVAHLHEGVVAGLARLRSLRPELLPPSTEVLAGLELIGPLYMVDVMCDEGVMPFYEQLGFQRSGGAVRRNYRWNSD